jgi:hypothetical protein
MLVLELILVDAAVLMEQVLQVLPLHISGKVPYLNLSPLPLGWLLCPGRYFQPPRLRAYCSCLNLHSIPEGWKGLSLPSCGNAVWKIWWSGSSGKVFA